VLVRPRRTIGFSDVETVFHGHPDMSPEERLRNIILASKLGPVTPFYGIVDGSCECGKPRTDKHKPGKHPRFDGWQEQNATADHQTISKWFREHPNSNFAAIAGVVSVVLDVDVRPGKDGNAELGQLEAESGQCLPPTVTVLSGSGTGAKHLYFRVPQDVAILQKPTGTTGIDFQRSRKAIIVPGSLHESGHYYKFAPGLSPTEIEIAELPEWLLKKMRKTVTSIRTVNGVTTDVKELVDELLRMGPPPGSMQPGRLRSDEVVKRKMRTVPMRKYPSNRSHSDSHWAWTLARNCCHHWDQYLRLWEISPIRNLSDTKCGRASYEASILTRAFLDQEQQWKSHRNQRPVEQSANPAIAKMIRKKAATYRETPRSEITKAVLQLHNLNADLNDKGISQMLNSTGALSRKVTRNNVKRIRHSYPHLWS
jgi:hypothetical protein